MTTRLLTSLVLVSSVLALRAHGQTSPGALELVDRGPSFYSVDARGSERVDVRNVAMFRRRVSLHVTDVPIADAMAEVGRQAGLQFNYATDVLPRDARVTVSADGISVAGALTEILLDAGVDVQLFPSGTISLVRRSGPGLRRSYDVAQPTETGTLIGRVSDAKTGEHLPQAVVTIEGTRQSRTTSFDGSFRLTLVQAGRRTLLVRRLGYVAQQQAITVVADSVVTVDVLLAPSAQVLDQVVTTVTGDQQLKSLGNSIGTINADSLVPTTPVTNLGDVINARVPGVQVIVPGGLSGASPPIAIRGIASFNGFQPLLYVDGIRVGNSALGGDPTGLTNNTSTGRLNDINPDDIESIEIVRGPSAATLYGTDAANGVILVTTKRGAAGAPQWRAYAEGGAITVNPDAFPKSYTGWGHTVGGQTINSCTLVTVAAGQCVQDSVTTFSPLRVASLSPLGVGHRGDGGLQVSGGAQGMRYFVSGDYSSELGYLALPQADERLLDSIEGAAGVGNSVRTPNAIDKYGARINITTPVGHSGEIALATGYVASTSRIPESEALRFGEIGPGYRDDNDGYRFGERPYTAFINNTDETARHFTGSLSGRETPVSWLTARATAGLDFTSDGYTELTPADVLAGNPQGTRGVSNTSDLLYSVDLGATATVPLTGWLSSATSAGVQYHRETVDQVLALGVGIAQGTSTLNGFAINSENNSENVVAGAYVEERFGIADQLFVTGAVRTDGATTFGTHYRSATYPKLSASWLVSRAPLFRDLAFLSAFRLRAAYGESGTQPGLSLTTLQPGQAVADGGLVNSAVLATIGNPLLQPERQTEFEGGADVDLFNKLAHVELTYYSKRNTNALYSVPLPSSLGGGALEENVGVVWNWGYEGAVSLSPIRARAVTWDVSLSGSVNHNQVITLGPHFEPVLGTHGFPSIIAGYPIYSNFDIPILSYKDANGDGIIEPTEVTYGTAPKFAGPGYPPTQATLATHIGVLSGLLTLGAQFDYRGGFRLPNTVLADQCFFNNCAGTVDRHASLAQQAAAQGFLGPANTVWGFYSDGEFIRFRELSLTLAVPNAVARRAALHSLSVTVAARNLALWTRYTGVDPESGPGQPYDAAGVPVASYWLLRVNMGL